MNEILLSVFIGLATGTLTSLIVAPLTLWWLSRPPRRSDQWLIDWVNETPRRTAEIHRLP